MSLFLAKQYWGVKVAPEEFDERHLQLNDQFIFVASFAGFLRVYQPERGQYKPNHLISEHNIGDPIMQILVGQYGQSELCVLLFKKVQFYTIQMQLIKEFTLQRNAFNMCLGKFGNAKKDLICIQSCDAMLMVYEAEQLVYLCQLSTEYFPLPGPITYSPQQDSILIQNSCFELESYKYSNIAAISQLKEKKRAQPDWTINLGEQAQKIIDNNSHLFIICEQMIFQIQNNGKITFQKRLEYPPASISVINENTMIISSFTHHLLIYKNQQLVWAAKTDHVAHGLELGSFNGVEKLIVTLNDQGYLQVLFLGTEQLTVQRELKSDNKFTYSQMDNLYTEALTQINKRENLAQPKKQLDSFFEIQVQIVKTRPTKEYIEDNQNYLQANGLVIQSQIKVNIRANTIINNLTIQLYADKSIYLDQYNFTYDTFRGGKSPLIFDLNAYSTKFVPIDRVVQIVANWKGGQYSTTFHLPMSLFCYKVPPIKSAKYKITLVVENLSAFEMFQDIKGSEESDCNSSMMTLQLADSQVSILVSKQNDKWRVQSDKFEAICFLINEIVIRQKGIDQIQIEKIKFTDEIPLKDIFDVIDEHFTLKESLKEYEKDLEQKANEFRAIQKKLLSRFKENNPTSFESLDQLLEMSFQQFMLMMDNTQKCQNAYTELQHKLKVVIRLMIILMTMRFNLNEKQSKEICQLFEVENNWEEEVYININYHLKNQIAEIVHEDTTKIKKIITILNDRLAKALG